jgi:AAA family ATP:ADP antiporter
MMLRPGEGRLMAWSAAHFFFLLAGYSILRPVRDEHAASGDASRLAWLMLTTFAGMLLGNWGVSLLMGRVSRRRLNGTVYRIFSAGLALLYIAGMASEPLRDGAGSVFFVWTNVFNLLAVSLFWSATVDTFTPEQGLRLFGTLGLGGTLGAVCGSAIAAGLAEAIGPEHLAPIAVVMLEGAVLASRRVTPEALPRERAEPAPGVFDGVAMIARSGYLVRICAYMLLFAVTSTLLYFDQARLVKLHLADEGARTAFFAHIDLIANALTLAIQCLLAGRVMTRLGVGLTLAITPVITIIGFAGLAWNPSLGALLIFQVARKGAHYALVRPTREVLFTVLSAREKFRAKGLIDTFLYRGGDLLGATPFIAPGSLGAGTAWLAIPLSVLWLVVGLGLGRTWLRRRAASGTEASASSVCTLAPTLQ